MPDTALQPDTAPADHAVHDTSNFLFDIGAQNERTRLAWTRTALAFLTGSAVLFRGVPTADNPAVAAIPTVLCLVVGVVLLTLSHRRYGHNQRALKDNSLHMPDGVFPALAAIACVFGGTIAVGMVFLI